MLHLRQPVQLGHIIAVGYVYLQLLLPQIQKDVPICCNLRLPSQHCES